LKGSEINEAKIVLADAVTTLLHGKKAAIKAKKTSQDVFERGGTGSDLPTFKLGEENLPLSIVQVLVKAELAKSGKAAKRLIANRGAHLNGAPLTDAGWMIQAADLARPLKLSAGKKRHALMFLER